MDHFMALADLPVHYLGLAKGLSLTPELIAANLPTGKIIYSYIRSIAPITHNTELTPVHLIVHDPHFLRRAGHDIIVYDDIGRPDGFAAIVCQALILEGRCTQAHYLRGGIRDFAKKYPMLVKRIAVPQQHPPQQQSYTSQVVVPSRSSSSGSTTSSSTGVPTSNTSAAATLFASDANTSSSVEPLTSTSSSDSSIPAVPARTSSLGITTNNSNNSNGLGGPTEEVLKALGKDVHPTSLKEAIQEPIAQPLQQPYVTPSRRSSLKEYKVPARNSSLIDTTHMSMMGVNSFDALWTDSDASYVNEYQNGHANTSNSNTAAGKQTIYVPEEGFSLPAGDEAAQDDEDTAATLLSLSLSSSPSNQSAQETQGYFAQQQQIDRHGYHGTNGHINEHDDDDDDLSTLTMMNTPEPVLAIKVKQLHLVDAVWYGKVVPFGDVPLAILDNFLYLGSCFAARPDLLRQNKITRVLRLGWGFAEIEPYYEEEIDEEIDGEMDGDISSSGVFIPSSTYPNGEASSNSSSVLSSLQSSPNTSPVLHRATIPPQQPQPQQYNEKTRKPTRRRIVKRRHQIRYYDYPIEDVATEPIRVLFEETTSILEEARLAGERVLVHCHAGVSRSSTVVLAYLMKYRGMSLYDAWNLVYIIRPIVRPNDGFARALQEYEVELLGKPTSSLPIFWMSESYSYYLEYLEWYTRLYMADHYNHSRAANGGGKGSKNGSAEEDDALIQMLHYQYARLKNGGEPDRNGGNQTRIVLPPPAPTVMLPSGSSTTSSSASSVVYSSTEGGELVDDDDSESVVAVTEVPGDESGTGDATAVDVNTTPSIKQSLQTVEE
ncbi:hypothetical protein SmJEL517_g02778 [Synchytrium microbalum]|uniref:protein-tyrosine-phosphatase n=1 Tax=Synchytrium microbalum TaxID=1806994 RepID=A0A507C5I6_9FUNG|nr:uncharacterized protein SmJEL517_g02778 [Synchytrium microbalum]TPX34751.1 hypothetical protein SmJEL517_g02778 [Synchytrium microbalum]